MISIKEFCCKDCGLDCSFQVAGINEGQVAQKIIHHMHADHGMNVIPADFMIKIKHSINNQHIIDSSIPAAKKMLVE
jgi:predicted small metal-binding protein